MNSNSTIKYKSEDIIKYCFGISAKELGKGILFLNRNNRLNEYSSNLENSYPFQGKVWSGLNGTYNDKKITIIISGVGPSAIGDCVYGLKSKNIPLIYSGTCGGLKSNIGDFIIGDSCICGDGFSQQLGHDFESTITPNQELIKKSLSFFKTKKIDSTLGKTYTTSSFIIEKEPEFRKKECLEHCLAIEMEAASFYAASNKNNSKSIAYFWTTDLPFKNKSFYDSLSIEELELKRKIYLQIPKINLELLDFLISEGN
jgi:purine-nucleoside phosphorylase